MTKIIVIGNEKGGSGKTTTAMHLIVSLMKMGFKLGVIDLDIRQQSLTRYIQNRQKSAQSKELPLEVPMLANIQFSDKKDIDAKNAEEKELFESQLELLKQKCDIIVIDTPGSDLFLSRLAHSYADTVITPINDSFLDVDLIAKIDAVDSNKISPGIYSAMVWEQKLKRASRDKQQIDWIVVRNRLSTLASRNKKKVLGALQVLSKRMGFRFIDGFSDRVIFKELFPQGYTLNDSNITNEIRTSISSIAAKQELVRVVNALSLSNISNDNQNIA